jgi:hypothetical protein
LCNYEAIFKFSGFKTSARKKQKKQKMQLVDVGLASLWLVFPPTKYSPSPRDEYT